MKFIKQFSSEEDMNNAISEITHGDGAFLYYYNQSVKLIDQRHPDGANCVKLSSVNMEPVKLDASSTKKTPAVADVLYSTADGKLTLDAQTNSVDNTPIAICVIPEVTENFKNGDDSEGAVKTARFVSLNYMNYNTPTTGYCAPACCCVAYSTPGTKSSDWYLPMPGELYQIYVNKTAINKKRTAIKGSGFNNFYYWSSREY